jgi:hypothetical protein
MTKIQNLKRFEHWKLEFGIYLLFVIWCLKFIKFKDSILVI